MSHPAANDAAAPSPRTRVRRRANRASYESETVRRILDASFLCHVGFVHEDAPRVIPTVYARAGGYVYLHGSTASQMLRSICRGEACITVTLLDGIVLARSAFHTSVNYRSVVLFGRGEDVPDPDEKLAALRHIIDHLVPGRWGDVRAPTEKEIAQARVVRVPIAEASAKLRDGDPIEEEEDYALPCWAGRIPLQLTAAPAIADARLSGGTPVPGYAAPYHEPGSRD